MQYCGWLDKDIDGGTCERIESGELAVFHATIDEDSYITFENQSYFNWFILKWS
jgi:hypothetical protein